MDRLVTDVQELMDHLELARAHVLGYSAGGFIAQHLAMDHSESVASLSLFGSSAGLKNSKIGEWIGAIRAKGLQALVAETMADRFDRRTPPALQSWFLDQISANDPALITRFMALTSELEWSARLGEILCPTLLVVPKGETIGSDTLYQPMRDGIKDLTFLRLDVAGHNICDMLPERCAAEVLRFLGKAEDHAESWTVASPS
jgi:pimeloyl-ACP methyl ester carboxylesterase